MRLELVTGKNNSKTSGGTLLQGNTTPWNSSSTPVKPQPGNKKVSAEVSLGPVDVTRSPSQRLTGGALSNNNVHSSPSHHISFQQEEDTDILLHTLLMVPDGRHFQCSPLQAPNIFLNCKLFWCDETVRSHVAWGQANPTFNFKQVCYNKFVKDVQDVFIMFNLCFEGNASGFNT